MCPQLGPGWVCTRSCCHHFSPQDGTAPLWIASQMGHSEVVRVMLLRGAERDAARHVSVYRTGTPAEPLKKPAPDPAGVRTERGVYVVCSSPGRLSNFTCSFVGKQSPVWWKFSKCAGWLSSTWGDFWSDSPSYRSLHTSPLCLLSAAL